MSGASPRVGAMPRWLPAVGMLLLGLCAVAQEKGGSASFREKPSVVWRCRTSDKFWYNSPLVHDGVVYIGSQDGKLYAVDAASGKVRWAFQTGRRMMSRYLACDEKRVFFGATDGCVYALDLKTGKPAWHSPFDRGGTCCNPCIVGKHVVFGGVNVSWTALDRETGAVAWISGVPARLFSYLGSDGTTLCGISVNTLYAADAATGKALWAKPLRVSLDCFSPVAVVDGRVYYVRPDGANTACVARDAKDGKVLWQCLAPEYVLHNAAGGLAVSGGVVYAVMNDLYAMDALSGKVLWRSKARTDGAFSEPISWPAVAGGVVLLGTTDRVVAFDAKTGQRLWDVKTGGMVYSRPAAAGGRICFGCDDANLYCLGYEKPTAASSRIPMRGPVAVSGRRTTFFMHNGALHAVRRLRSSLSVGRVDFERGELVYKFSMPGARVAWLSGKDHLWGAGRGGACRVDLTTGAIDRQVPVNAPGMAKCRTFSHIGDTAVAEGKAYGKPGKLFGFDVAGEARVWEYDLPADVSMMDVLGATRVYLEPEKAGARAVPKIGALDARSGAALWGTDLKLPVDVLTTAVEDGGTLYLGCDPGGWRYTPVFAIDAQTGRIRWQGKIEGGDTYVLTVDEKALYLLNFNDSQLIALRRSDGTQLWSVGGFTAYLHEPIRPTPSTGPLFLMKDNVTVVSVDRATGKILSEALFPNKISRFEPLGRFGCVLSEKGEVYLLDLGGGR